MLIEFTCANCRAALRVREQDQGKQARCPRCGAHTPVTQAPERTLPSDGVHWLRGPDGAVYGPCTSAEIRGWVLEGRIDNRFQVRTEPHASWQSMYGSNVHVHGVSVGRRAGTRQETAPRRPSVDARLGWPTLFSDVDNGLDGGSQRSGGHARW